MATSSAAPDPWAAALAGALAEVPPAPEAIAAARTGIAGGQGARLAAALFTLHTRGDDKVAAVAATMATLERLFPAADDVAGYLMARLQPIASQYKHHHVHDAIGLWMDDASSAPLADALMTLAREGVRPQTQARCRAWAEAMRARASEAQRARPATGD